MIPLRPSIAIGALALLGIAAGAAESYAGDVAKGRTVAAVRCQMCHGMDGQSKVPEAPNLSGQLEQYIIKELDAFRSGERKNDMMNSVVQQISEDEVADLAAYYSGIAIRIEKVPGE